MSPKCSVMYCTSFASNATASVITTVVNVALEDGNRRLGVRSPQVINSSPKKSPGPNMQLVVCCLSWRCRYSHRKLPRTTKIICRIGLPSFVTFDVVPTSILLNCQYSQHWNFLEERFSKKRELYHRDSDITKKQLMYRSDIKLELPMRK